MATAFWQPRIKKRRGKKKESVDLERIRRLGRHDSSISSSRVSDFAVGLSLISRCSSPNYAILAINESLGCTLMAQRRRREGNYDMTDVEGRAPRVEEIKELESIKMNILPLIKF